MEILRKNPNLLDEIDAFFIENKCKCDLHWTFQDSLMGKFNLKLVSDQGSTRCVFKQPYSREVIKVGFPVHNKGEVASSLYLRDTPFSSLFAHTTGISRNGYVMGQEFIPRKLPEQTCFMSDMNWIRLRNALESNFSYFKLSHKDSMCDFHDENMRVCRDGNVKIIDYSHLCNEMFMRDNKLKITTAVKRLRKLSYPHRDVTLTFETIKGLKLTSNEMTFVVTRDGLESLAIFG